MRKTWFPQILNAPDGPSGGGASSSSPDPAGGTSPSPAPASPPSGAPASPAQGSNPSGLSEPPASGASAAPAAATPGEVSGDDDRGTVHGSDDLFEFPSDFTGRPGDEPEAPPAAAPAVPTPPQPAQPAPPAPAPAAAPAQPAQPEAPAPAQPATPPQGPQEQSPPLTPAEPGRLAESMAQNEQFLIDQLASREFVLSPEEVEALNEDATAYVPKLLAKVHLKSQINMMRQLQTVVPAMIQQQMAVFKRNTQNEDKFFSRWPEIDRTKHGETVRNYAKIWRQANPNASLDEMIEDLGPMVMMKAKIAPGSRPAQPGAPQPAQPNGHGRQPPPPPFKPALGGPAAPPAPQDEDPWAGLGQDHEE